MIILMWFMGCLAGMCLLLAAIDIYQIRKAESEAILMDCEHNLDREVRSMLEMI